MILRCSSRLQLLSFHSSGTSGSPEVQRHSRCHSNSLPKADHRRLPSQTRHRDPQRLRG
ncbi:hypothetical protein Micbo1qcDRAFT_169086, partial [Microdochium bolleyi]